MVACSFTDAQFQNLSAFPSKSMIAEKILLRTQPTLLLGSTADFVYILIQQLTKSWQKVNKQLKNK